jgi:hypothetical protein
MANSMHSENYKVCFGDVACFFNLFFTKNLEMASSMLSENGKVCLNGLTVCVFLMCS